MIYKVVFLSVFIAASSLLVAQEYDYVLPDTLPDVKERSRVTLPIKPRMNEDVYVQPSYQDGEEMTFEGPMGDSARGKDDWKEDRMSVSVEVGASVASDFNGNSAFNTYAAPHIRYRVSERVAIRGGVMMSQTYFDGWTNYSLDGTAYRMPSRVNTNMLYGRLDYMINDRLLVYGSVYSNITTIPEMGYERRLEGIGYSVGMEYKMSENSFLQIQVHRNSGYNPFVPYSNFGFGSRPISYFP